MAKITGKHMIVALHHKAEGVEITEKHNMIVKEILGNPQVLEQVGKTT